MKPVCQNLFCCLKKSHPSAHENNCYYQELTRFVFAALFERCICHAPLLKFWRWNEASRFIAHRAPLACLPPVVVIFTDDLKDVSHVELDSGLSAWNQVIFWRIIFKQCTNKNLQNKFQTTSESTQTHKYLLYAQIGKHKKFIIACFYRNSDSEGALCQSWMILRKRKQLDTILTSKVIWLLWAYVLVIHLFEGL